MGFCSHQRVNSGGNWAAFSCWHYLHWPGLMFLLWGVGSSHILCLLLVVLPLGLQGASSPLCLCCSSCHETPVKGFFKQWSELVQGSSANTRMMAKVCFLRGEQRYPSGDNGPCCRSRAGVPQGQLHFGLILGNFSLTISSPCCEMRNLSFPEPEVCTGNCSDCSHHFSPEEVTFPSYAFFSTS